MFKKPLDASLFPSLEDNPHPWAGLVTSLPREHDYLCDIEGQLPKDIHGRLFKLGPGLYERGQGRKRMVLDGDGMIQNFCFHGGKVRYRNRFIRTKKFLNEEKAGRFLYPTLSTHGEKGWWNNLGINLPHQANITTILWNNRLLAFDESQKPYELDPQNLNTMGEAELDSLSPNLRYWAHWKLDTYHQQWHCLGLIQGPKIKAEIKSFDFQGRLVKRTHLTLPRASYFHDWFVSENYFGFLLHPAVVSLATLMKVGLGLDTFSDALKWRPELGNLVLLVDRKDLKQHKFEGEARWMWHSVNTWEENGQVIADFIGNREGGGLGDPKSPLFQIMENKSPALPTTTSNHLVRYRLDISSGKLSEEILSDQGNFELPTVSATQRGIKHRYSHFIYASPGDFFARGIGEWDVMNDRMSSWVSTGDEFFSEPLSFDIASGDSARYLSSLVYDGAKKKSYLGIFQVGALTKGPLCKIWLQHHSPLGFHGFWSNQIKE
jgi:all-trans-8'-apo-beta-carotenal 15,15'-oxygenase